MQLEELINNRRILMEKVSHLPKDGHTFLLPDFDSRVFAVPCSKDEYMKKYCEEYDFRLPPGREILTHPPTHPGLYKRTMQGIIQIDPNCRRTFGRGRKLIKQEQ